MEFDPFNFILTSLVFIVYGFICLVSLIFTFSLDTYIKIHDRLDFPIFSSSILNPLEQTIDWFDSWAMRHHKIAGSVLAVLSLIDMKLFFTVINHPASH